MSKIEELTKKYCEGSSFEDACMMKPAFIAGYHQAEEDIIKWIKNNWREYINVDKDGVVCFGHWENELRKYIE